MAAAADLPAYVAVVFCPHLRTARTAACGGRIRGYLRIAAGLLAASGEQPGEQQKYQAVAGHQIMYLFDYTVIFINKTDRNHLINTNIDFRVTKWCYSNICIRSSLSIRLIECELTSIYGISLNITINQQFEEI